jgi:hypothetical protein
VRGKSVALILLILSLATTSILSINAGTPPPDHVKLYIWNPASASNVYPAQPPGPPTYVLVYIDSPAAWYDTPNGIVGVTASLRVDPNVVEVLAGQAMPDTDFGGYPDSFLGDFLEDAHTWDGYSTSFLPGPVDKTAGTITGSADVILGFSTLGLGAGNGPKPVWRWVIRTWAGLSLPLYSPISLVDCYYTTVDGVKHPVEVVESGHYGTPPPQFYMSGPPLPAGPIMYPPPPITDPTNPAQNTWHELYPNYCHDWTLTSHEDNGDGYLSASDQIDMINGTGWKYWFHVDAVTVTIHWTWKDSMEGPPTGELGVAEPAEFTEGEIGDPIGTAWHQIYPVYCKDFVITSWSDNGNGYFDPSDQFDFEYFGEGVINYAHLDEVTTDIFLSQKGEPEPPELEFPLGAAVEVGLIVAVAYIWWTRRRRLKEVL